MAQETRFATDGTRYIDLDAIVMAELGGGGSCTIWFANSPQGHSITSRVLVESIIDYVKKASR